MLPFLTEWQVFLVSAVETIMKVADLLPAEVLSIVDSVWKETCNIYLATDKLVRNYHINIDGNPYNGTLIFCDI